eukprot:366565-Chlamydomonas_euryale.AAC.18
MHAHVADMHAHAAHMHAHATHMHAHVTHMHAHATHMHVVCLPHWRITAQVEADRKPRPSRARCCLAPPPFPIPTGPP